MEIEKFLQKSGAQAYRLKQINTAIFKEAVISFEDMDFLPKDLRRELKENCSVLPFDIEKVLPSSDGKSYKALIKLVDGNCTETVLMSAKPGTWSVCVSSQVGCAMKCAFCATGALGFTRNLTDSEIWGQVLFWNNFLREKKIAKRVTDVVYMGMGEPFNNFDNVASSIKILISKDGFNMAQRSISVSTCGIPDGMEKFAEMFPQANLALSLHSADEIIRKRLMPVSATYSLEKVADGLRKYFKKCNRKVFIEYILLAGVNSTLNDAKKLTKYLDSIGRRELLLINLIIFNPVANAPFQPSSQKTALKFKELLQRRGYQATIRQSFGQDIDGACGQLAFNANAKI